MGKEKGEQETDKGDTQIETGRQIDRDRGTHGATCLRNAKRTLL